MTQTDMADKVLSVYNGVVEVIAQFHPEAMAVEQLYAHYDHPRTAILMGHARGVIFLAAAQQDIPVVSYAPRRSRRSSPATAGRPRSRCSGPSSASWAWRRCRSRPTWPTRWRRRCAIITRSRVTVSAQRAQRRRIAHLRR